MQHPLHANVIDGNATMVDLGLNIREHPFWRVHLVLLYADKD